MTHVVAGYPDPATSRTIVETMAGQGADLIEIQIPFSDPLADGPTITAANRIALENGTRPRDCFAMVR
ncbi:MAG: tryptophan synthase subunit alpha, partial [Candidatus Aminicenantes bacterium]|nr:tryptophan synthase subunit alpha [Candidatus Aminicenantes bacterium]